MSSLDVALALAVLTLLFAALARRVRTPMPVVLAATGIMAGIAWRLVPGLPVVRVPPSRVLFIFLPPLLTTAAYALPLQALRRNARPILLLAVGLVLATMAATAATAHYLPGLSWAAAFALGAIIAPPDPVAASALADRTGLRHELVVILEGEGLINDAVAIAAYHLAVNAALGSGVTPGSIALAFVREAPVGIGIGLALGLLTNFLREQLDDTTLEAAISLLVPYLTYELADRLGGSAVLAVVTLGFVLQRARFTAASPVSRLTTRTIWSALRFASTALVFLLLGFLIGEVVMEAQFTGRVIGATLAVIAVVVTLRLAWMFTIPRLVNLVPGRARPLPSSRELVVLGWSGMRGVVSLALALALPALDTAGDVPNDARHLIIVATFGVIVATLVIQGSLLLPLVHRLGIGDASRSKRDEHRIRRRAQRAGLAAAERARARVPGSLCESLAQRLRSGELGIASDRVPLASDAETELARTALAAEREVVSRSRDAGRIGEELAERLETELDLDEARLSGQAARFSGPGT